jgi:L-lactate dehydrogenase (cytochrome)
MMMSIARCNNVEDFRRLARRRLPAPMFHYIDGAADDEWSLKNNTRAFERYELINRALVNVAEIDTRTHVLGCDMPMPVILAPTGGVRLFHHDKEFAVARAAQKHGVMMSLSTVGTTSMEDVAKTTNAPKMFQVYLHKDLGLTRELVERARAAGYDAICLTVDTPVAGNRERDKLTGLTFPPKLTLATILACAMKPEWSLRFVANPEFKFANIHHRLSSDGKASQGIMSYINSQFDRTANWQGAEWLAKFWGGPFAIKGVLSAEDAKRAVDVGATALMISNHGGRQLDGSSAPVDCVRPMRDAVGRKLELIVDGGVRRGSHIVKSLALGADAVSFGRPTLYSLAAGGEKGVDRMLTIMREELERDLALVGCAKVLDLNDSYIRVRA